MIYVVVCSVALLASALTFFSGFGLGTLLLPAFAIFFPVEQAVALTAIVHFLNGIGKVALVGRHAQRSVVLRFGVPAAVASLAGAGALLWLAKLSPLSAYTLFEHHFEVTPVKLTVGVLIFLFTLAELLPRFQSLALGPSYLPVGGLLSGFFGGLSGNQGALRSAFLARAGLSKEAFIGSGAVIACIIDVSRLSSYAGPVFGESLRLQAGLLLAAVLAAFAGTLFGNRFLKKLTMSAIQRIVAAMLVLVALGLAAGVL